MLSCYSLVQRVFKELARVCTETVFRKSDVWFQVHYPFSNLPHFPFTLPLLYSFLNDNGVGFPSSLPFSYKDLEFEYVMTISSHGDPLQQVLNRVLCIVWNWVKKCSSFWKVSHWFLHEAVIYTTWKINKSIGFLHHNPLCQFSGLHGSNQSLPWLLEYPGQLLVQGNLVAEASSFSSAYCLIPDLLQFILPSVWLHWSHLGDLYSDLTDFSFFCQNLEVIWKWF